MNEVQVVKKKTVLVKRTGDKIVVNIPFDIVSEAMSKKEVIKIGKEHMIRTKAVNERYGYNVTDEIEIFIEENFPEKAQSLLDLVKDRRKKGKRVSKEIIANMANDKNLLGV